MPSPAALLLAAGASRRFGADKLLHPLPDGRPIALAALVSLRAGVGPDTPVYAVLRPAQTELARRLEAEGCRLVIDAAAVAGMGASLAAGVAACADAGGWLVALADMPFIRPDTHAGVMLALIEGAPLAAPFFRHRRGHPVGFAADYRDALLALSADEGARAVLSRHAERLVRLDTDDGGVVRDIDTPADLT